PTVRRRRSPCASRASKQIHPPPIGKVRGTLIINSLPHREVVWVIFGQISSGCLLLLLPLWACGQRTCVVHHVHSDVGRAAYSIRGSVTSPCPALGPTGASRTWMQRPRTATRPEACR